MKNLEKRIQDAKNQRDNFKIDIREKQTQIRIRTAELSAIESFIDVLNSLKL